MKKLFFLALAASILAACDNDSDPACTPDPDPDPVTAQAIAISPSISDTKTTVTGNTKTSYAPGTTTAAWANGDAIGLFCPQSAPSPAANVQFTASGAGASATWSTSSTIDWADGTTSHTFLAYYPYASGNTAATAVKLPALTPQTGALNAAQDFLISNNKGTSGVLRSGGAVGLVFTHALSLIEFDITITAGIASGTTLTSFTLTGGVSDKIFASDATSTINLSTGVVTAGGTANTLTATPSPSPTLSSTMTPEYLLVLPGTFTAPTLTLVLKEGSNTLNVPAAALPTMIFAAGNKYVYAVTVSRSGITISNPTITDWGTGTGGSINAGL